MHYGTFPLVRRGVGGGLMQCQWQKSSRIRSRSARKFFEQEIGQRTLQMFGGRDSRWTKTTIRCQRTSPPFALWYEGSAASYLYEGQSWGWDGIDRHIVARGNYNQPLFPNGWTPQGKSFIDLFLHFLLMVWFTNVVVAKTSNAVQQSGGDNSTQPVTFGEMIRFSGSDSSC